MTCAWPCLLKTFSGPHSPPFPFQKRRHAGKLITYVVSYNCNPCPSLCRSVCNSSEQRDRAMWLSRGPRAGSGRCRSTGKAAPPASGSSTFLRSQPLPCCSSVPIQHLGQCQVPLAHAGSLAALAQFAVVGFPLPGFFSICLGMEGEGQALGGHCGWADHAYSCISAHLGCFGQEGFPPRQWEMHSSSS